jgi:hypothetical protein
MDKTVKYLYKSDFSLTCFLLLGMKIEMELLLVPIATPCFFILYKLLHTQQIRFIFLRF